jgi:hypothetical protein
LALLSEAAVELVWVLTFRVHAQNFWGLPRKFHEGYWNIMRRIDAVRLQKGIFKPKGEIQNIPLKSAEELQI